MQLSSSLLTIVIIWQHACVYFCAPLQLKPISVTTRAVIPDQSPLDVQNYVASPGNWPKIVSTSMGVSLPNDNDDNNNGEAFLAKPLPVGKTVDELFGLPPILPLTVRWTCTKSVLPGSNNNNNKMFGGGIFSRGTQSLPSSGSTTLSTPGRLEFFSPLGLEGVAQNCEMIFDVQEYNKSRGNNNKGTEVFLEMKYEPASILAILAVPILAIDNAVAIKFLLPAAMRTLPELDTFRNLMGSLYLVAGLAHLLDCVFGSSQLLTMAGAPTFDMLPLAGQLVALLWCLTGPLSFALSKLGGAGYADIGLILYGVFEVAGAGLISLHYGGASADGLVNMDALVNAILVQGVVAGAWFYSANKQQ